MKKYVVEISRFYLDDLHTISGTGNMQSSWACMPGKDPTTIYGECDVRTNETRTQGIKAVGAYSFARRSTRLGIGKLIHY